MSVIVRGIDMPKNGKQAEGLPAVRGKGLAGSIGGRVMIKNITPKDFGTLAICAIRYCHGRQTYMPDLVRGIVAPHLPEVSDKDLTVMINDCDFQDRMRLYGDERIDKPGWIRWKELLIAEKGRRASDDLVLL